MKLLIPTKPITPLTGVPAFASTATPRHGETMIQSQNFSKLLFPARFCPRSIIGEAIRQARVR